MNAAIIESLSPDNAVEVLKIIAENRRRAGEMMSDTLNPILEAEDRVYLAILNRLAPATGASRPTPAAPPKSNGNGAHGRGARKPKAPSEGESITSQAREIILKIDEPFTSIDISAELQRRGVRHNEHNLRQVICTLLNYLQKKGELERISKGVGKKPGRYKRTATFTAGDEDPGETEQERRYKQFRSTVPDKSANDES